MARISSSVVVVTYESRLFNQGGNARRWANAVERRFTSSAQGFAPVRSGVLRAGIRGEVSRVAPTGLVTTIVSAAPYSMFVMGGTTGPIMANRYWNFVGRTGLKAPRGALLDPSRPFTSGFNFGFLRERGYLLKVRAGNGYAQRYSLRVSGQSPNNIFGKAAVVTAAQHSSLNGWHPIATTGRFH